MYKYVRGGIFLNIFVTVRSMVGRWFRTWIGSSFLPAIDELMVVQMVPPFPIRPGKKIYIKVRITQDLRPYYL